LTATTCFTCAINIPATDGKEVSASISWGLDPYDTGFKGVAIYS